MANWEEDDRKVSFIKHENIKSSFDDEILPLRLVSKQIIQDMSKKNQSNYVEQTQVSYDYENDEYDHPDLIEQEIVKEIKEESYTQEELEKNKDLYNSLTFVVKKDD
jgi:hypothetical protein